MKTYPSIPKSSTSFLAYVFDKLDGSNLRITWTKAKGWTDFGTRTRSISQDHPIFKEGYIYFQNYFQEALEEIIRDKKWLKVDFFFEFYGPNSLAGRHQEEPKQMTLIDVAPNNKSFIPPELFLNTFNHLNIPNYLGIHEWNETFIHKVFQKELEGITLEGVVGKSLDGKIRAKAKTNQWVTKVTSHYPPEEACSILNS